MTDAFGNEWCDNSPGAWVMDIGLTFDDLAAQFSTNAAARDRLNRCIDEIERKDRP